MKRRIYSSLVKWKKNPTRKPLLVRGARQVGKSFIINELCKKEFNTYVVLNFERNPEYKAIFTNYNPIEIIEKITLFTGKEVKPGETIIFIDEIQECPEAIMSLRYFYEEMPEQHIIGAGSLLEFSLQQKVFKMPVGRVQYIYMYPMSFSEFLISLKEEPLNNYISQNISLSKISNELHLKLVEYIRKYFIIGGMPAVVKEYISTRNILACQQIQHSIIETYKDDFVKYARKSQFKYIIKVFSTIPSMIGNKVAFSKIDRVIKSRDLSEAIDLLETAGIIYKVRRTIGSGLPLEAGIKENYYKPIFLDIGLMHAVNGIYSQTIREEDLTTIYKGAVAEQFVGQELLALNNNLIKSKLYYWVREAKSSSAEIDFLIAKNDTIIPVEVKSGKKGSLKSLLLFLETFNTRQGVKISQAKYKKEPDLLSIPFYAIGQLLKG